RIHARGMHAHQHLAGPRLRRRDFQKLQNFRPAELEHLYRFHEKSPQGVAFGKSLNEFIVIWLTTRYREPQPSPNGQNGQFRNDRRESARPPPCRSWSSPKPSSAIYPSIFSQE